MSKAPVKTPSAPAAVGPYSQAVIEGRLVFLSGQIPLDPASGKLVEGDVATQARRVLDNLGAVLSAAGCGFDDVCKMTVFVTDLGDFAEINRTYATYFGEVPPARSTIQVAALPLGARLEMDAIAVRPQ